jgi:hypothetical protein
MIIRSLGATALITATLLFSSQPALAQFTQQGPKLVGTGVSGYAEQGKSTALSADGNTAIVGGPGDNSGVGAAWVYTRSGGVWAQWVGLATAHKPGRRGSTLATTVSGPSKAANWSALAPLETPPKASWRCRPTATPPSWAGLETPLTNSAAAASGRRGSTPAATEFGPSRAASWSAPARLEQPNKALAGFMKVNDTPVLASWVVDGPWGRF